MNILPSLIRENCLLLLAQIYNISLWKPRGTYFFLKTEMLRYCGGPSTRCQVFIWFSNCDTVCSHVMGSCSSSSSSSHSICSSSLPHSSSSSPFDCLVCRFAQNLDPFCQERLANLTNTYVWEVAFDVEGMATASKNSKKCAFSGASDPVTFAV